MGSAHPEKQLGGQTSLFKTRVANAPDPGDVSIMQGQKRYVNDYVVNIFSHYINCCRGRGMRGNVTWASFFGGVGRRAKIADSTQPLCESGLAREGAVSANGY